MQVAIVGAGIGGLTAGLLLRRGGHDVTIFEQAPELEAVGAGIQLGPNAISVLEHAGLGPALRDAAVFVDWIEGRDWTTGKEIYRLEYARGGDPVYGAPFYDCHRAELQTMMVDAVGVDHLRLDHRLSRVETRPGGATLVFEHGDELDFDAVIGADGIHSSVRSSVFGNAPARFSGMVAYRGTIGPEDAADLPLTNNAVKWWGPTPSHHFVAYALGDGSLNCVGVVPESRWLSDSWTELGDVASLRKAFEGFADPVGEILERVETTFRWALYDREVSVPWARGNVALLGDACHAMLPFMAQGAGQAIEDAAILSRVMGPEGRGTTENRLTAYETLRRPRASAVHEQSRANLLFSKDTANLDTYDLYAYRAMSAPLLGASREGTSA